MLPSNCFNLCVPIITMRLKNIEFKAKIDDEKKMLSLIDKLSPEYLGEDIQIDTYYDISNGRLKLRRGNIENSLIFYKRNEERELKQSDIILYRHIPDPSLEMLLKEMYDIKVIVKKRRKIFFVEHVKIHLDEVDSLGTFIEVEVIDSNNSKTISELEEKCEYYKKYFKISDSQIVNASYSDLILSRCN